MIVVDELADLMMTAAAEFEKLICRLAQLARAVLLAFAEYKGPRPRFLVNSRADVAIAVRADVGGNRRVLRCHVACAARLPTAAVLGPQRNEPVAHVAHGADQRLVLRSRRT